MSAHLQPTFNREGEPIIVPDNDRGPDKKYLLLARLGLLAA
jgi:hypothetical protein